ncbi:MAG: RluA family pseudouridine synthase, partial [Bacteroidota bacterium]
MKASDSLIKIATHQVPLRVEKQRLQEYAVGIFDRLPTRSSVKKAIKKGWLFIDAEVGQTADWILGGEVIELYAPPETHKAGPVISLKVLYEDEFLAIVNKPAGILVSGNKHRTVARGLCGYLQPSDATGALLEPKPVHRLDFATTGALLIGKTAPVLSAFNTLFEEKQIRKSYLAVTSGRMENQGEIDIAIDGKASHTRYEKLATIASTAFEYLNLVWLQPRTGRRHQLRKHLAAIGNPIFGDKRYGPADQSSKGRPLYLHAYSLAFAHPEIGNALEVKAPVPES